MRFTTVCLLLLSVPLLAAGESAEARNKKDLASLQGAWKVVSVEVGGETQQPLARPAVLLIKGNKVLYAGEERATITLDAATTPRCIDLAFTKSKDVREGIYTVEKDALKVCVNRMTEGVKERPNAFATKDQPEWRLVAFERVADEREAAPENQSGFVGIQIMVDKDTRQLLVAGVIDRSPAMKAGLKKDDVLLKVDGQPATDLKAVVNVCRQARPGSEIALRVKRGDKEEDVTVTATVVPFFLFD